MTHNAAPKTDQAAGKLQQLIGMVNDLAAELRRAADDLAVTHTVLETHLSERARDPAIDLALGHACAVERTLGRSAEKLDEMGHRLGDMAAAGGT